MPINPTKKSTKKGPSAQRDHQQRRQYSVGFRATVAEYAVAMKAKYDSWVESGKQGPPPPKYSNQAVADTFGIPGIAGEKNVRKWVNKLKEGALIKEAIKGSRS